MANVYIEARPKGRPEGSHIDDFVVEDHADQVLATLKTQGEAIAWAKKNGHAALVARVRHLNDKKSLTTGGRPRRRLDYELQLPACLNEFAHCAGQIELQGIHQGPAYPARRPDRRDFRLRAARQNGDGDAGESEQNERSACGGRASAGESSRVAGLENIVGRAGN